MYEEQNAGGDRGVMEQGGRLLKRSTALWAGLDGRGGRRGQAGERLKTTQPRVPYEQMMFYGMLSDYLDELGQPEEARKYADYVIEHGGTLALRSMVLEKRQTKTAESQSE